MPQRYKVADLGAIITELCDLNDRARAIVGGSLIDWALEYAITRRLLELSPGGENGLYSPGGPLHSCNAKIQLGQALGLYGARARADLERINEIRNVFAHDMNPVAFEDQLVAAKCQALLCGHNEDAQLSDKDRFIFSIQWILTGLLDDVDSHPEIRLKSVARTMSE